MEDLVDHVRDTLKSLGNLLGNAPDLAAAVRKAIDENAALKRQVEDYFNERVASSSKTLLEKATETAAGTKLVSVRGTMTPDMVKALAFNVRALSPKAPAFVGATVDASDKPLLTVMFTDDLTAGGLTASKIIREAAKAIKGGGGGQPGFAQAGGKDASGITQAYEAIVKAID